MANTASRAHAVGAAGRDRERDHLDHDHKRTPAQWYCLLAGAALLLAGIFGFIADASFDTGSNADTEPGGNGNGMLQGDSFLGFEVNGWHNVVHLLSGIVLLAAFRKAKTAKPVALGFGVVYGIVTIIGLIDGNDILGIIPVNPADNILHIGLSLLGIISGLVSRGHDAEDHVHADAGTRGTPTGRKVETRTVDRTRRATGDRITRDVAERDGVRTNVPGEVTDRHVEHGRTVDPEIDRDPRSDLGDRR